MPGFGYDIFRYDFHESSTLPVNTVLPVISGTNTVGSTLSCTTGTWTGVPAPTYAYQWKRGGVDIGGATSSTYTLVSADGSTNITCTVTATNVKGSASATSNTIAVAAQYIVDTYSPVVAYSLRKLSSTATNCLRVRRSSDNTEQDIGFTGNDLDTTALLSFVGVNDGFVVSWYNQGTSGGTYQANQPTATGQFRIVNAGVYDGGCVNISNDNMAITNGISHTQNLSSFFVFNRPSTGVNTIGLGSATVNRHPFVVNTSDGVQSALGSLQTHAAGGYMSTGNYLATTIRDSASDVNVWVNGNILTPRNIPLVTQTSNLIGRNGTTYNGANTILREIIFFQTDQTANKSVIETDINTYYGIY